MARQAGERSRRAAGATPGQILLSGLGRPVWKRSHGRGLKNPLWSFERPPRAVFFPISHMGNKIAKFLYM
jgi:hypothetical protein